MAKSSLLPSSFFFIISKRSLYEVKIRHNKDLSKKDYLFIDSYTLQASGNEEGATAHPKNWNVYAALNNGK